MKSSEIISMLAYSISCHGDKEINLLDLVGMFENGAHKKNKHENTDGIIYIKGIKYVDTDFAARHFNYSKAWFERQRHYENGPEWIRVGRKVYCEYNALHDFVYGAIKA